MKSFSFPGVNPVRAGSQIPLPPNPPSSALVILTKVSLGTVSLSYA